MIHFRITRIINWPWPSKCYKVVLKPPTITTYKPLDLHGQLQNNCRLLMGRCITHGFPKNVNLSPTLVSVWSNKETCVTILLEDAEATVRTHAPSIFFSLAPKPVRHIWFSDIYALCLYQCVPFHSSHYGFLHIHDICLTEDPRHIFDRGARHGQVQLVLRRGQDKGCARMMASETTHPIPGGVQPRWSCRYSAWLPPLCGTTFTEMTSGGARLLAFRGAPGTKMNGLVIVYAGRAYVYVGGGSTGYIGVVPVSWSARLAHHGQGVHDVR